jgi:hypothetical protein
MLDVDAVPQIWMPLSPDWFKDGFVEKEFVASGELQSASEQPVHLSEGESELLLFGEDVVPGELSIQTEF